MALSRFQSWRQIPTSIILRNEFDGHRQRKAGRGETAVLDWGISGRAEAAAAQRRRDISIESR